MEEMKTNLDNNLANEIELKLDEADIWANETSERLTHEEVFRKVRERIERHETKFSKLKESSMEEINPKEDIDWGKPVGKEEW